MGFPGTGGAYQSSLPMFGQMQTSIMPGGGTPNGHGGAYQPILPPKPDRPTGYGDASASATAGALGGYGGPGYMSIPPPPTPIYNPPPMSQTFTQTNIQNMPMPPQIQMTPMGGGGELTIPASGINTIGKSDLKYNAIKESEYR